MVLSLSESWYGALIPTRRLRYRLANANHKKARPHQTACRGFSESPKGQVITGNTAFGVVERHLSSLLPCGASAAAPSFKHWWRAVHVVLGNTRRNVFVERLGSSGRCPGVFTSYPVNAVGRSEQPPRGERLAFALRAAGR